MQMSDNKVATMEDEMNKKIGAAKCKVESASADVHTTVFSERLYTALVTAKREGDHKKDREPQSLVQNSKIRAKDSEIAKKKQQTEKYCDTASTANAKIRDLALKNRVEVDDLKIQHNARVQELQSKHVAVINAKKRDIKQLHNHGNEYTEMMYDMADGVGEQQKVTRNASKSAMVLSKLARLRLVEMNDYRDKF